MGDMEAALSRFRTISSCKPFSQSLVFGRIFTALPFTCEGVQPSEHDAGAPQPPRVPKLWRRSNSCIGSQADLHICHEKRRIRTSARLTLALDER